MTSARSIRMTLVLVLAVPAFCLASLAPAQDKPAPPRAPGRDAPERDTPRPPQADRPARPAADAMPWLENIEVVRDVVYATVKDDNGNERELQLDAAFPRQGGDAPLPAVIYIHGGGWSGGSRNAGHPFTVAFANGGYFACTISYRLSGQAKYPAAVHDCKAAVRFLRAHAEELGIDPDRIGVWGHSAGGHLSAMLGLTGDNSAMDGSVGETGVTSSVNCFVDVSGPSALAGWMENGMVAEFLGGEGDVRKQRAEEASPINHADKNDPPSLIVHGTADDLVNVRQAQMLYDKLKEVGASTELLLVEGAGHGIRDKAAYEKIAAFFDQHLGGNVSKVMTQVNWNQLNQMQPPSPPRAADMPSPPRGDDAGRPRRPGADRPDAPRPPQGDRPDPPSADSVTIPAPLDAATIQAMSKDEAREAMAAVAVAIGRAPNLDKATRDRLRSEFVMLRNRLKELDGNSTIRNG